MLVILMCPAIVLADQSLQTGNTVSADQLMSKSEEAAKTQNICKFTEKTETRVNNSMKPSWGDTENYSDFVFETRETIKQGQPSIQYEVVKETTPSIYGDLQNYEINYEKMQNSEGTFVKSTVGIWVKTDDQTEDEKMEAVGINGELAKKSISYRREKDAKRAGKDCWVVSYQANPELFKPLIEGMVKQNLSEVQSDNTMGKDYWQQIAKNTKVVATGKSWIDKTTGLEVYEESQFTMKYDVNITVPDSGGNTIRYSFTMQETSKKDYYDWGIPAVLPDISKAVSPDKYDRILENLNNASKA
ncbi:MAG TPA: hypothetical protein VN426_01335 [Syntrophomonadaceae bacterium]|nr:hypothetical protein [Syntrophomonadaceae bacterium]